MRSPTIALRLLLIGVALPIVFVAIDEAALRYGAAYRWQPAVGVEISSWFVAQTALLSYLTGRLLPHWGWRLLLLGWCLVLVNLLLATGALDDQWNQRLLALAFLSAEFGALAAWLLLGDEPLAGRIGLALLAGIPVKYLASVLHFDLARLQWGDVWAIIVAVQMTGTVALVAVLRAAGYRIQKQSQTVATAVGGPLQFSIRHLLIATTVVAVIVPIVQGLQKTASPWMGGSQWLQAAVDGLVLALISLTALWMALGRGRWLLKVGVFALLAILAGAGLYWLEEAALYRQRNWPARMAAQPLTDAEWRWVAWTLLTGSFLAAMLLVLQATGYRLVRQRRPLRSFPI